MDIHVLVNLSNSFRKKQQDARPCPIVNSYEIYYTGFGEFLKFYLK